MGVPGYSGHGVGIVDYAKKANFDCVAAIRTECAP